MSVPAHGTAAAASGQAQAAHPSAPIPVHGIPIGAHIRTVLGETGLQIFPLILGSGEFGWTVDMAASHDILDTYVGGGGNAVHTADSFSGGRSEYIVGQWLASRRLRDEVVLISRVGAHSDHPGLGPVELVRAVESTLTRLGTDHIDVLSLDARAGAPGSLEETLATAEWLVESGKIGHLGAIGLSAEQLVHARILSSAGYPRITVLDVPFNVLRRHEFDDDLRLVATAQSIAVTPSHALEHGFLTGKHRDQVRGGLSARAQQISANLNRRGIRTLKALDAVAAESHTTNAAVAVAWLLAQRAITAPIVNAYAPAQVEELMQGVGVRLTRAQLAELARAAQ